MEDRLQNLRKMYEDFRKGDVDPLAVRNEAVSFLEEVKEKADREILEEVEDTLIDLEFSMEEDRCRCHQKCSSS